jgi:hypothetical protein
MAGPALLLAATLPFLPGCSFTVGRLGLASTRPIEGRALARPDQARRQAEGVDCLRIAVLFPITGPPSIERALAAAQRSVAADHLRDVTIRYRLRYVPFVYGTGCYVVEGKAP